MVNVNPLRGFRDLYPKEKGEQSFIFKKTTEIAEFLGYEAYDGPVIEPVDLYLNKTSRELLERQTFQIKDKKENVLVLRPEITPTLARMVAKQANEMTFPVKLFNIGVRFRYEAPQKGRSREFFQADFDILGSNSVFSDAEIIYTAISILKSFGATSDDFVLYLNSRDFIEQELIKLGVKKTQVKSVLSVIDKKNKVDEKTFSSMLIDIGIDQKILGLVVKVTEQDINSDSFPYFNKLFEILKLMSVDKYCKINPSIVRGLDYYTGFVFEVFDKGLVKRSLLGGGRYNNLINQYNSKLNIPGVGFAFSDVVISEFLQDKKLFPQETTVKTKYLVSVFNSNTLTSSYEILNLLRENNIPCEIYLDSDKNLDKQLKYADKKNIPYVIIIGPDEIKEKTVTIKNLNKRTQEKIQIKNLLSEIK
jgi:histidyl-tRNA synthetase